MTKVNFLKLNEHYNADCKSDDTLSGYDLIEKQFTDRFNTISSLEVSIEEAFERLNKPITVSMEEINSKLDEVYALADSSCVDEMLKPIFTSTIDGAMRAFKLTSKTGLTASRVYEECESFEYNSAAPLAASTDRLTEVASINHTQADFGNQREIVTKEMRDHKKMRARKEQHFGDAVTAKDEASPDTTIFKNNKEAFSSEGMSPDTNGRHPLSAEVDHTIPCAVLCEQLKSNKALHKDDIKEILNADSNLAVISRDINNAKRDSTNTELVEKIGDDLTKKEQQHLLDLEKQAQRGAEKDQNRLVMKNLNTDKEIQKRFATDAVMDAGCQAGGDIILYIFKPIYFEMKDSILNGLEDGVNAATFKTALSIRFTRVKEYILSNVKRFATSELFNFLKSFVSMLVEAIIHCLTGIFQMIWRLVKEGLSIITNAVKVIRDPNKSTVEKGDAILQLAATSIAAVSGIYLEKLINTAGIPEPWSIILSSIASATVMSGLLYLLNKLDIFNAKYEIRRKRIDEIFNEMNEQIHLEIEETTAKIHQITNETLSA